MDKLDHEIPPPEGWATAWVDRDYAPLDWYIFAVALSLSFLMIFIQMRGALQIIRARKELDADPSNRAAIFKKIHKRALKTDRGLFKIALAYMANTLVVTLVDGCIAIFVLVKDASDNPEVWDKQMIISVASYVAYLVVLFMASFVLVPLLQMFAVTWALTRFSRKNKLSDYVPQARSYSSLIAFLWAAACFCIVCGWPVVGNSDQTATRFVILEAAWGSALAWLEAAFLFNFLSHAIGEKELSSNSRVGEVSVCIPIRTSQTTLADFPRLSPCSQRQRSVLSAKPRAMAFPATKRLRTMSRFWRRTNCRRPLPSHEQPTRALASESPTNFLASSLNDFQQLRRISLDVSTSLPGCARQCSATNTSCY